jgi:regulator of RNase E activity RraA
VTTNIYSQDSTISQVQFKVVVLGSTQKLPEELYKTPTASLSDALDALGIKGFMNHDIKPCVKDLKLVGGAVTVKDVLSKKKSLLLEALEAIESANPGDVYVRSIEGGGEESANIGLFGGLMALGSKTKGLAGAVIDAGARDITEYEEMGFPVFSKSVVPSTSLGRTEVVGVNVPICCGGVLVNPGDVIVGDNDGVVVIPKDKLDQVLESAKGMDEKESRMTRELKQGRSLLDTVKKYSRI